MEAATSRAIEIQEQTEKPKMVPSRIVTGVIIRRSCMGKKLSFADVRTSTDSTETDDGQDIKDPSAGEEGTRHDETIKVAFRRHNSAWDDSTSFPNNRSELPYGAHVSLTLDETSASAENKFTFNVISWEILKHPKQDAEDRAAVGKLDSGAAAGGLSYSTYLRERGNLFSATTTKGQYIRGNKEGTSSQQQKKKRARASPPIGTGNTRENNGQSPLNQDNLPDPDINNDDLPQEGGHGDKVAKSTRARLFAHWIMETFGKELLEKGSGVVDVAGGKGMLSIELACHKVPCTVIEPVIRRKQQQQGGGGFPVKRDAKRVRKAGGPLPRHLPTYFNRGVFLEQYGHRRLKTSSVDDDEEVDVAIQNDKPTGPENKPEGSNNVPSKKASTDNDDQDSGSNNECHEDAFLIDQCSCLVGLHPDQTTQDILEIALSYHKNVAIVPCCVFPSFFPIRKLKDGTIVVTYEQFCEFLCQQDPSLQRAVLPFPGRNIVIYRTDATR